jgi:hypothetical protein
VDRSLGRIRDSDRVKIRPQLVDKEFLNRNFSKVLNCLKEFSYPLTIEDLTTSTGLNRASIVQMLVIAQERNQVFKTVEGPRSGKTFYTDDESKFNSTEHVKRVDIKKGEIQAIQNRQARRRRELKNLKNGSPEIEIINIIIRLLTSSDKPLSAKELARSIESVSPDAVKRIITKYGQGQIKVEKKGSSNVYSLNNKLKT